MSAGRNRHPSSQLELWVPPPCPEGARPGSIGMLRKMQVDVHQVQYGASFTKSARVEGAEAWRGHLRIDPPPVICTFCISYRHNIIQILCFDPTLPQHGLHFWCQFWPTRPQLRPNLAPTSAHFAPSWTRLVATSAQADMGSPWRKWPA